MVNRTFFAAFLLLGFAGIAHSADDVAELEEQAMKAATAKVQPSVVRIETFGGLESVGNVLVGTGPTTGLVVSPDGYIISSAFNFIQKPSSILVTLPSGKRVPAQIVGRDRSRMIMLLKVSAPEPMVAPQPVPRKEMIVGQWAIALGRTLDASNTSMSVGILSATDRIWGKAIQTDAKVSPSNYGGPLVDIRGRVLGVLVPLSPQSNSEVAGAEWYDSGIGFAVPLEDILQRLEKLKAGQDLLPGLLGVALKGRDIYADDVIISSCPANGPAAKAGLKPDDKIIEVDGVAINRQAQLRHALGRRYAGDTVNVVVLRGDQRVEANIELIDRLDPYAHPFLGILPMRDGQNPKVRFVFPDGPAAQAGILEGDIITAIEESKVLDAGGLRERILAFDPGQKVKIEVTRGTTSKQMTLDLGTLPTAVPDSLPAAQGSVPEAPKANLPLGVVDIKIPEESNDCVAYIPEQYHPQVSYGLVVWLGTPGRFNKDQLIARWKRLCDANNIILLAPQSNDPKTWLPTEADFIRKTIEDVRDSYNLDENRIVLYGYQGGGTMAYLAGFEHSDLFRGIATVDATVPSGRRPPENEPANRIAFFNARSDKSRLAKRIDAEVKRLGAMKFPVTVQNLGDTVRDLNADELAKLLRWLDTLDRI